MRLFLLGFMGSGKTTIGKSLANRLGLEFVDLDREIERVAGKSIPELFEELGEAQFRTIETKTLRAIEANGIVVATGGGTPCFNDNMAWMNEQGITILIDVPLAILVERLLKRTSGRPMLKNLSAEELPQFVAELMERRKPYYEQAVYQLRSVRKEETVNDVINLLQMGGSSYER